VEIKALLSNDRNASQVDLTRALEQAYSLDEEDATAIAGDVFKELLDRYDACTPISGRGRTWEYPFTVSDTRTLLEVRPQVRTSTKSGILYQFLLITSRADMDGQRHLENLDPAVLFEQVCADVLLNFWGGTSSHSGSMVFGTARKKTAQNRKFRENIEHLCNTLREGRGMKSGAKAPGGGDGKLDVVVWRKFSDGRTGGLIGFGQCKTGIHWRDHLEKLVPRNFCGDYLVEPLIIDPMRIYLVPHRVEKSDWDRSSRAGGLLFDRCRIVQYGYKVSPEVFNNCKKWLAAALQRQREGNFIA
jgi:hypothetical protein